MNWDRFDRGILMALRDQHGDQHSHTVGIQQGVVPLTQELPDRGHWVGPRAGDKPRTAAEDWAHRNGTPLDPPESTAPKSLYDHPASSYDPAYARRWILPTMEQLQHIIDCIPTTGAQRNTLQAAYDCLNKL